jgi:cbb3-type cytochrome oxidase subunit 1
MKLPVKFILCAACYGLAGLLMGMGMGASENFTLMPAHAHLNLLGWFALTLYGLSYAVFPKLAESRLATAQFYVANIGLLLMIPSLIVLLLGNRNFIPVMAMGELCTVISLVLFIVNLLKHRQQL